MLCEHTYWDDSDIHSHYFFYLFAGSRLNILKFLIYLTIQTSVNTVIMYFFHTHTWCNSASSRFARFIKRLMFLSSKNRFSVRSLIRKCILMSCLFYGFFTTPLLTSTATAKLGKEGAYEQQCVQQYLIRWMDPLSESCCILSTETLRCLHRCNWNTVAVGCRNGVFLANRYDVR